jgi:hypothetical protein
VFWTEEGDDDMSHLELLTEVRDALRRMDPAWCTLAGKAQLSDQEFDEILGRLEDAVEDGDGTTA